VSVQLSATPALECAAVDWSVSPWWAAETCTLLQIEAHLPQQQAHELATGVGVTARGWVPGRAGWVGGGSLVCALLACRRCRFRRTIALLSCLAGNRADARRRLQPCIMNVT
jgi:hypothetical protein